ncbi:TlpA disulfide reductase family protein [Lysobacter sp. H23M47]|uniref:TlpA family protein disulfide reductase n=1 Tax=Lysobacter sp. H23M47 TaxID=2781024 RepID=UPI001880D607|nr:TlpA disulfide reductase family protein [Lysobacter sp. H23M47]QOW24989.1 TlpA family protein disulfide reductase [Lysobacter sp. H23M47]
MRIAAAAAVLAVLLLGCQPADRDAEADRAGAAPVAGAGQADPTAAPAISPDLADSGAPGESGKALRPTLVVSTLDGSEYDLAAHRGNWVLVNFWATWCNPCLKEMPELSALAAMREDIEVVGLAYEAIQPAEMKAFLLKHPVTYPIAILDTANPPADFDEPRGLPMTWLIAPDGRVERKMMGPVTAAEIEEMIAASSAGSAGTAPDGAGAG